MLQERRIKTTELISNNVCTAIVWHVMSSFGCSFFNVNRFVTVSSLCVKKRGWGGGGEAGGGGS